MVTIEVSLDDDVADALRQLAAGQNREPEELAREALTSYARRQRPLPKGLGRFHSGRTDGSERSEELLREAAAEGRWP